jgi:predicted ATPase/DNA-binding XRE family transcriptional regulator
MVQAERRTFADLVRAFRIAAGLTQDELAERAGLSGRGVQDLERGIHRSPHPDTTRRLAEALGLGDAERSALFGVLEPVGSSTVSRAAAAVGTMAALPVPLTSFVGRQAELDQIERLLTRVRLLTLTGAGGIGKTRLALEATKRLAGDFPDGTGVVELAALINPESVPLAVARVLGVSERPGDPLQDVLVSALGQQHVLLVLDNCEHLLQAAADLAEVLLRACLGLRILATSREPLRAEGETVWRVPSLSLPSLPDGETIVDTIHSEAGCLFVERAQSALPSFVLTDRAACAVADVCRRLDGIPLALELAAARVTALTPEQIASRLDNCLELLVGGRRTAARRQRTLQATIDWSHDLLTDQERALFRHLAVFAGGWKLEAAEAVAVGDDCMPRHVLDVLTRLVEKSLVQAQPQGEHVRYRMLESIHQYAANKLVAADEETDTRNRHADWHLALAEQAESELRGRDQRSWLVELDTELDNLYAALDWCHKQPSMDGAELRLVAALGEFWIERGYLHEGRSRLEAALTRQRAASASHDTVAPMEPSPVLAAALRHAGYLAWRQGDGEPARERLEASAALARELHDARALTRALCELQGLAYYQGEYDIAASYAEEAMVAAGSSDDRWTLAAAQLGLGMNLVRTCRYVEGRVSLEQCLMLFRELGDEQNVGSALSSLGIAALGLSELGKARELFTQSLNIQLDLGLWRAAGFQHTNLGQIARLEGDYATAGRQYAAGLPRFRDAGDRPNIAWSLEECAGLAMALGQPAQAARLFGAATVVRERISQPQEPYHRTGYERDLATARSALDAAAFGCAWKAGRGLLMEDVIAEAMAVATSALSGGPAPVP